ncbi:MAG: methyltransferase domain-containing protein [Patescibacteria group bacterium]|jgi:ubiquinone/menaquinone biosynthesis C-methylase UbiE
MEAHFLHSPSAELRILDEGGIRRIFIKGKAYSHGKLKPILETVDTLLKLETIQKMVELKGDWWLDELERRQDANYVRRRLVTLINRFGDVQGARILDIGSGSGSSSLIFADLGASLVQGVEPNPDFVRLAKMRAHDEGSEDRVLFSVIQKTSELPFEDARFDIVSLNAVIEHIKPEERSAIIKEAFRVLKPGGLLVITETPNRAFPYDGHTTGLPLIPWLPLNTSISIAKKLSRHVPKNQTREQYISQGIVGGSYWQIKNAFPNAVCQNLKGGDAKWKCTLQRSSFLTCKILSVLEWLINRLKLPLDAFMPMLDLVFKKT